MLKEGEGGGAQILRYSRNITYKIISPIWVNGVYHHTCTCLVSPTVWWIMKLRKTCPFITPHAKAFYYIRGDVNIHNSRL